MDGGQGHAQPAARQQHDGLEGRVRGLGAERRDEFGVAGMPKACPIEQGLVDRIGDHAVSRSVEAERRCLLDGGDDGRSCRGIRCAVLNVRNAVQGQDGQGGCEDLAGL